MSILEAKHLVVGGAGLVTTWILLCHLFQFRVHVSHAEEVSTPDTQLSPQDCVHSCYWPMLAHVNRCRLVNIPTFLVHVSWLLHRNPRIQRQRFRTSCISAMTRV
jgi:hypothetical protein